MMVNWVLLTDGLLHGKFEIFPDSMCDGEMYTFDNPCENYCDGEYLGYWEGTWLLFVKDESARFMRCQGKGKGALKGLILKVDGGGGIADAIFNGFVLSPPSVDGE